MNGYAAKLKGAALQHVLQDPNVDYVEEDSIVHISPTSAAQIEVPRCTLIHPCSTQNHPSDASSSTVQVSAGDLGQGTNIFIIDTGVLVTHNSFGGRASWGAVSASINVSHGTSSFTARFGGYPQQDGNGHGYDPLPVFSTTLSQGNEEPMLHLWLPVCRSFHLHLHALL